MNTIDEALDALKRGRMILVVDDQDRENEGDLIMAAEKVRPEDINFMAREGRGLICAALDSARAGHLGLAGPRTSGPGAALHGTAFTQSVDLIAGCSSGISAHDRALTIGALADVHARPEDFARPGHLFPLIARDGGVLVRRGHTEATVDLCRLAGFGGTGVLCEVMEEDGTMARMDGLERRARDWNMPLVSVQDLALYRLEREALNPLSVPVRLPRDGKDVWLSTWPIPGLPEASWPVLAASRPDILRGCQPESPEGTLPLVRIHSECLTGETFGSRRCECGPQLELALDLVSREEQGAVIYLRQEGRGIGLGAKLQAYALQDQGMDTWDANTALGHPADARSYRDAAWMLHSLGWNKIRLLSNNPHKARDLETWGIQVRDLQNLHTGFHPENLAYREAKRLRFGHILPRPDGRTESTNTYQTRSKT